MDDQNDKYTMLGYAIGFVFILLLILGVVRLNFGNGIIGDWFEKPSEYTTQYWVYLEPNNKSTKNYRVKGDIEKISLNGEDTGYNWGYFLRTVYWNNGGNSDFDECQLTSVKGDYCEDFDGKGYIIRLGEKVEK